MYFIPSPESVVRSPQSMLYTDRYLLSKDANIELKIGTHKFTDRSHQNKRGFEGKKLSGTDFTAFQQKVYQTSGPLAELHLPFSYLGFRVCLACYPPESFKIIFSTCIWFKFVNTSFHSLQRPSL